MSFLIDYFFFSTLFILFVIIHDSRVLPNSLLLIKNDIITIDKMVNRESGIKELSISPCSFQVSSVNSSDPPNLISIQSSLPSSYGWLRYSESDSIYWAAAQPGVSASLKDFCNTSIWRIHPRSSSIINSVDKGSLNDVFFTNFTIRISNLQDFLDITVQIKIDTTNRQNFFPLAGVPFGDTFQESFCSEKSFLSMPLYPDADMSDSFVMLGARMQCTDGDSTYGETLVGYADDGWWYNDKECIELPVQTLQLDITPNSPYLRNSRQICFGDSATASSWFWGSPMGTAYLADTTSCGPGTLMKGLRAFYNSKKRLLNSLGGICEPVTWSINSYDEKELYMDISDPYIYLSSAFIDAKVGFGSINTFSIRFNTSDPITPILQIMGANGIYTLSSTSAVSVQSLQDHKYRIYVKVAKDIVLQRASFTVVASIKTPVLPESKSEPFTYFLNIDGYSKLQTSERYIPTSVSSQTSQPVVSNGIIAIAPISIAATATITLILGIAFYYYKNRDAIALARLQSKSVKMTGLAPNSIIPNAVRLGLPSARGDKIISASFTSSKTSVSYNGAQPMSYNNENSVTSSGRDPSTSYSNSFRYGLYGGINQPSHPYNPKMSDASKTNTVTNANDMSATLVNNDRAIEALETLKGKRLDLNKKISIRESIHSGSTCLIMQGNLRDEKLQVAVKLFDKNDDISSINEISVIGAIPPCNEIIYFIGYFDNPYGYVTKMYSTSLASLIFDPNININTVDVIKIAQQVVRGLSHLNSNKIVHFDINPGNILLEFGSEISAVISDFGSARKVGSLLNLQKVKAFRFPAQKMLGSHAPEILSLLTQDYYDKLCEDSFLQADIYSFAIMLFQVIVRAPAWNESDPVNLIQKIVSGDRPTFPDYLLEISEKEPQLSKVIAVIKDCWTGDPTKRPRPSSILFS